MNDRFKFRVWNTVARCMYPTEHFGLTCEGEQLQWIDGDKPNHNFRINETDSMIYMQSTGLKDKNGKLIYEGDIVKWGENTFAVEWDVAGGCGCCDDNAAYGWFFPNSSTPETCEIVGNIYQNPELLIQKP